MPWKRRRFASDRMAVAPALIRHDDMSGKFGTRWRPLGETVKFDDISRDVCTIS